ncbi:MAG TPA: prenyltransferase/squalene oxidase repeat-containing protein [bacterium]|nr:prenyltransferase/squalene oxidase repeat-containing protein [bacterium]
MPNLTKSIIFKIIFIFIFLSCSRNLPEKDPSILKAVDYIRKKGVSSFGMDYIKQDYPFALKYPEKDDFGKNFVSAFVLSALDRKTEPAIFNEITSMLTAKQGKTGLWSFDDHGISTDSDTTLTVLIALMHTGDINKERSSLTRSSIESIYKRFCGLASINNPKDHSNFKTHLEPTANYLYLISYLKERIEGLDCIAEEIIKRQNSDGSFSAYWYPSNFFATFLAVRALSAYSATLKSGSTQYERSGIAINNAVDFLKKAINNDKGWGKESNAMDTAFAIMTLGMIDTAMHRDIISEGVKYLKLSQNADGSWNGSVIFNYYYTQCEYRNYPEPWHDINRNLISTALALKVLRTFSAI